MVLPIKTVLYFNSFFLVKSLLRSSKTANIASPLSNVDRIKLLKQTQTKTKE